jgi:hypothetical protein
MVVDRPLKKSGAPPAVNPDAIFSFFSPRVCVCGGVRKRETETELKELVFEETHGTKRERESFFLSFFLEVFNELDSFFMIITES